MTERRGPRQPPPGWVDLRQATEADHPRLVEVIDEWWGGRRMRSQLPRLWLRHLASGSWIAERLGGPDAGSLLGFLVGFTGDDPSTAVIHLLAVDPNHRRQGIGTALVERFATSVAAAGAARIEALVRPDERPAVLFAEAVGFEVVDEPPAHPIFGVPAYDDWDGPGEDRAVFVRPLAFR